MDNLYSDLHSGAQYLVQVRNFSFFCLNLWKYNESESHSVMSDSLRPHGLYSPWNSPGQNTGVGSHSFLQGIFPTQGSNPGLLHCRWILYQLSHRGHPRILKWVAYLFSSGSSWPRNWTGVSCITGRFFTNWTIREAWKYNRNLITCWAVHDIHYRYAKLAISINYPSQHAKVTNVPSSYFPLS